MIALLAGLALAADEPTEGGVVGGVEGGVLGPPAVPEVHVSEVHARKKVEPVYPEAARKLGIEEATCVVHFIIDPEGHVQSVGFVDCPEVFRQSTIDAVTQWEFDPPHTQTGEPTSVGFTLRVKYVLGSPPGEADDEFDAVVALGLGGGTRSGGGAAALRLDIHSGPSRRWYREASVTALLGPKHDGESVSFWREDLLIGPQVQAGPAHLALSAGMGLDGWGGAQSLRVPLRASIELRPGEDWVFQLSGQPSVVLLGGDDRKGPGLIDDLAVEGSVGRALWGPSDEARGGLELTGGWLDWPSGPAIYGALSLIVLPPAAKR